jgi:hypothetical protein
LVNRFAVRPAFAATGDSVHDTLASNGEVISFDVRSGCAPFVQDRSHGSGSSAEKGVEDEVSLDWKRQD